MFAKKALAYLLVALLLLGSLGGCGDKAAVSTLSNKYKNATPPKTGPVGEWDIPIPDINPIGSQDLYVSTAYEIGNHDIKYIDNFAECNRNLKGELWTLEVNDPSGVPLYFLKKYAEENKMNVFSNQYGDRLTFNLTKDEESLWWGDARETETGYILKVIKEMRVPVGKEKKFTTAGFGDETQGFSFITSSSGKKPQTTSLKLPNGNLSLNIYDTYSTGIVNRYVSDIL